MAIVVNDKKRKGEKRLGVLYDEGKVRRRREWRGLKDTLYDYGRWLYLLSILARVIVKPRNVKAMFRYRWFANYLAVPHMLDKFTIGLRDEPLRITHTAMDFVVKDVAQCIDNSIKGDRRTGNNVKYSDKCVLWDENAMTRCRRCSRQTCSISIRACTILMLPSSSASRATCAPCRRRSLAFRSTMTSPCSASAPCRSTLPATARSWETALSQSALSVSTAYRPSSSLRPCVIRRRMFSATLQTT